jgi:hypothetical protein
MTATTIRVQMAQRKDTAANWTAANPILLSGEIGYETDTKKFKIGDGTTNWNSLAYLPIPDGSGNLTITGNLEIGTTGSLTFEGSTANGFETTLAVTDPTADRTITLPNVSGTVVTTGDTGSVTSTMIADGTIVNADISGSAEIAVSKLANGTANQVIVTDGTNVSWSDNLTLAGDLTVNGTTTTINTQDLLVEDKNIIIGNVATPTDLTADGGGITLKGATDKTINWVDATDAWTSSERFSYPLGSATAPAVTFTGDPNSGLYSPGADQVAISTNGTGRLFVNSDGTISIGSTGVLASPTVYSSASPTLSFSDGTNTAYAGLIGVQNRLLNLTETGTTLIQSNRDIETNVVGSFPWIVKTANTERMRLDSSGRLGLGTSSVGALLHANQTTAGDNVLRLTGNYNTSGTSPLIVFERSGGAVAGHLRYNDAFNAMQIGTTSAHRFDLYTNSSTALTIDSSQRVGIGTTSPTNALHVNSGATGTSTILESTGSGSYLGIKNSSGQWTLGATSTSFILENSGGEALRVDGSRRLLVGTSTGIETLTVQGNASISGRLYSDTGTVSLATGVATTIKTLSNAFNNNEMYLLSAMAVDGNNAWKLIAFITGGDLTASGSFDVDVIASQNLSASFSGAALQLTNSGGNSTIRWRLLRTM